jgi:hypothetical protein
MKVSFILTLLIWHFTLHNSFSQYAPFTAAGSSAVCSGTEVDVPLTVVNFNNITSISLRLDYNPTKIVYDTFVNPNPLLPGIIAHDNYVSNTLRRIMIIWSDVNPKTLSSGATLLDLLFSNSISTDSVIFNNDADGGSDCEYTDAFGMPLIDVPTSDYYNDAVITNLDPATAGQISGMTNVCNSFTGVNYSVDPVLNATGYVWTVPPGASITNGINTNSILVDYPGTASSGNIVVYGTNTCGDGPPSPSLWVNVNPIPPTPVITQQGPILISNASLGNQWYDQNGIIPGATDQQYIPSQDGDYYVIVTISSCSSAPSDTIHFIYTSCDPLEMKIIIKPNPFTDNISLQLFSTDFNDLLKTELLNIYGKTVYSGEIKLTDTRLIRMRLPELPNGIYFLILKSNTIQSIRKLIKS